MANDENRDVLGCEEAFLSEADLLQRLPISRRTLFEWRTAGKIPFVRIGRRLLFDWGSVREALLRLQRESAK